jgi:hypothetical protein
MPIISDLISRCDICSVWGALGGSPLRGRRGRAFWRGGTHDSVALDLDRGLWFDHGAGEGGDAVALVQRVAGCDFREAVRWLADLTGAPEMSARAESRPAPGEAAGWIADLKWARWWAVAAGALAELVLAQMKPSDPQREAMTALLRALRLGDAALVAEYREWRTREPALTRALARAGQRADARTQRNLAEWIRRGAHGPATTQSCSD